MPKLIRVRWPGDPTGLTRAARRPYRYEAFVPDRLVNRDFVLPAELAADLAVKRCNRGRGAGKYSRG